MKNILEHYHVAHKDLFAYCWKPQAAFNCHYSVYDVKGVDDDRESQGIGTLVSQKNLANKVGDNTPD